MPLFAGADVGGTKTSVLLAEDDRELARATAAGAAVRPGRALVSSSRIASAVRSVLAQAGKLEADVLVVGAAGAGREPARSELREGLRIEHVAGRVVVTGDVDIALEAAFGEGPGIVVVSGTGSIVVGRRTDGSLTRAGGLGWQMGDEGSGYAIGRAALQAVGRADEGRGPATTLSERLLAIARVDDFDGLVGWSTTAQPGELAAFAAAVAEAAESGDQVAGGILADAASALESLVASVSGRWTGEPAMIPVALTGGGLAQDRPLGRRLASLLDATGRYALRTAPLDPAEGALRIARRIGPTR
ncbi:MAG: N-acetylglucosamine kinase [Gemmatimonadales bacterium]